MAFQLLGQALDIMTKSFRVAHIHEQGQDIIIVPRDGLVMATLTNESLEEMRLAFQLVASEAELKGIVCLVWEVAQVFHFAAPLPWHPFFRSIDMSFVVAHLNRTLTISYEETP